MTYRQKQNKRARRRGLSRSWYEIGSISGAAGVWTAPADTPIPTSLLEESTNV